jgi:hypothetical protein
MTVCNTWYIPTIYFDKWIEKTQKDLIVILGIFPAPVENIFLYLLKNIINFVNFWLT